jgi:hypothetical protein
MTLPANALGKAPSGGTIPPPAGSGTRLDLVVRLAFSLALVAGYYAFREELIRWLQDQYAARTGGTVGQHTMGVWLVAGLIVALVVLWRRLLAKDKRFHAPLLITSILIVGDASFGILENQSSTTLGQLTRGVLTSYSPTFVTIVITVLAEMLLGRFYYGKWPHLASAYVSGISAGILIKSPALWPFVMCGLISITSKYVLRIGDRHLWNPTNFGVTTMLFLAPQHVASLSVQAGNEVWAALVIWILGGMILYQLGRLHQPVAFLAAFVPLTAFRSMWTGHEFLTELAPITSPMFQLYIFFMITDPKTTTKTRWSQVVVVVLVAVMETFLRVAFRDVHSLFHALFIVGPISNVIEIAYDWNRKRSLPAPAVEPQRRWGWAWWSGDKVKAQGGPVTE